MRDAKAQRRSATEREYVQAIGRWLDGGQWEGADLCFTAARGLTVRLTEDGDALTQDRVTIVTRLPTALPDLPSGTRTSHRLETRALAALAIRGREDCQLVWDGQRYVQRP